MQFISEINWTPCAILEDPTPYHQAADKLLWCIVFGGIRFCLESEKKKKETKREKKVEREKEKKWEWDVDIDFDVGDVWDRRKKLIVVFILIGGKTIQMDNKLLVFLRLEKKFVEVCDLLRLCFLKINKLSDLRQCTLGDYYSGA